MGRIGLIALSVFVALIALELFVKLTKLDIKLVFAYAYYVEGDFIYRGGKEIYQPSKVPGRLYEANPMAIGSCINCLHSKETAFSENRIQINSLGFRDKERVLNKPQGVFRILVFGGSNTFGISVSNSQTYPALLEARLNGLGAEKFEVWNAGLNAYNMTQKVAYAEQILDDVKPDLIIFQDLNRGRRAFFYTDANPEYHFEQDPTLFAENFPPAFLGMGYVPSWHQRLLNIGVYRLIVGALNRIKLSRRINDCQHSQKWMCYSDLNSKYYFQYSDQLAERRVSDFVAKSTVPIIRFDSLEERYCRKNLERIEGNLWLFSLCEMPKPDEYRHMHPPSYVYPEYVSRLVPAILRVRKDSRGGEAAQ